MKRVLRNNGLSLALLCFFITTLFLGQFTSGMSEYNDDRRDEGMPALTGAEYFFSPHFVEATSENWESEFFQMFIYVVLTVGLFQKGSSESKDPDKPKAEPAVTAKSPWPARRGGLAGWLYSHSLSTAFALLFFVSFAVHAVSGSRLYSEEERAHGRPAVSAVSYMKTSRFWFESFQNWQSEFLAIGSMVVLSVFLREKGSPESKSVATPYLENE